MSSSSKGAAPAATVPSLCQHLIQAGDLAQPFALYATPRSAAYQCPACIAQTVERRLQMPNQQPAPVAESLHFTFCQHGSEHRACWSCLSAVTAAVTLRWAELFHTDRQAANRLLRVTQLLNRHYDPAHKSARPSASRHYREQEAGTAPKLTVEHIAEQRLRTRRQNQLVRIRQERRLPEHGAIHRPQAARVEVISPVR
jgi:hypothetical protein